MNVFIYSMASRRARKTEHGVTDFDALLTAIKLIKIGNISIRKAAASNGIPDKSLTRYTKKFDQQVEDIKNHNDEELLEILRGIASYKTLSTSKMVDNDEECIFKCVCCCYDSLSFK